MTDLKEGVVQENPDGVYAVLRNNGSVVAMVPASDKTSAEEIIEEWKTGRYSLLLES